MTKKQTTGDKEQNDLMVITYRNHSHAIAPDTPNVTYESLHAPHTPLNRLISYVHSFVMVHYFFWSLIMIGLVVALAWHGYWYISLTLLALYLPGFLNNDQLKRGRPWHAFRQSTFWHPVQRYLEVECVREAPLDPKKQYIFGMHPHGILILSRTAVYGGVWEKFFPGIEARVLAASPMFWIPGSREICLWMGAIDARRSVAEKTLRNGMSLIVYPGGSAEIFETDPNSTDTVLIGRKGFVKLAIQTGKDIVPAFVFGEKWMYHRAMLPRFIKDFFMNTLKTPLILFWGRLFTWLPLHQPMSVVFGAPISVQAHVCAEPSQEVVDAVYEQYRKEMNRLYNTYKDAYGYSAEEKLVWRDVKERSTDKKAKKQQ